MEESGKVWIGTIIGIVIGYMASMRRRKHPRLNSAVKQMINK